MFLEILWEHTRFQALKFTILLAVLQLLVSYVSSSYVSEIFTDVTIEKVQRAFIAITIKQILNHILDLILFIPSTMEGMNIAKLITKEISEKLLGVNNVLSLELPNSVIHEACVDSFHAYFHTIWQIVKMLPELVDYYVVLYVSTGKSWIIIQVIGFGSMLLLLLLKTQEKALADISKKMMEITKETRKYISRLWTDYFSKKSTCYGELPPNPALDLFKYTEQWLPKDVMVMRSHLITDTAQEVLYLTFLFLFKEIAILSWLVMNHQRLWRGIKLWIRLKEIVMHNGTKMDRHLDIYQKALVSQKKVRSYVRKYWIRRNIVVKSITVTQIKCQRVVISSPLFIGPKHHVLIIEGSKGSGKTYLIAILTGFVDVEADMLFGKTRIEPSQIPFFVVSQDVASHYTQNPSKTITHSANKLFRDSGKNLVPFLSKFGLEWIAENDLDEQLGENEKSLSPGTIRTIVLAHLMWDLQQYLQSGESIKFVVLDEVDTAIDFGTVRKFYIECILPLLKKYGVPCIIISHSKEFKDLVRELGGDTCRTLTATKGGNVITYL
jgi:ABC-type transport system involved in cytochrome c biogenesis ATPase subunit